MQTKIGMEVVEERPPGRLLLLYVTGNLLLFWFGVPLILYALITSGGFFFSSPRILDQKVN